MPIRHSNPNPAWRAIPDTLIGWRLLAFAMRWCDYLNIDPEIIRKASLLKAIGDQLFHVCRSVSTGWLPT